jgi:3,4-dihydroxy 2-butanone 4-phosphate synthase/GTP cyclohydrolase II
VIYDTTVGAGPFLALVKGEPSEQAETACRVHSGALISDVLGTDTLEGRQNLRAALEHIEKLGHGVVVYLPPKVSLEEELSQLTRQHGAEPPSTGPSFEDSGSGPPLREFGLGAQILRDLGVRRLRLLTNHPRKIAGIEAYGLEVLECVSLSSGPLESD